MKKFLKWLTVLLNLLLYTAFFNITLLIVGAGCAMWLTSLQVCVLMVVADLLFLWFYGGYLYRQIILQHPAKADKWFNYVGWLMSGFLLIGVVVFFYGSNFGYANVNYGQLQYKMLKNNGMLKRIMPKEAKNITINGRYGLGRYCDWKCEVKEADFLKFAQALNYKLAENQSNYNANPETNSIDGTRLLKYLGKVPERFYYYSYICGNYGGCVLLYDRDLKILYGHYSSN